jgi:hypothetical protein
MNSQLDEMPFDVLEIGFETVESKTSGLEAIRLTDEPYSGIIFQYGKVEFEPDEENDTLRLKFEYDILDQNKKIFDEKIFEKYIGDLLTQLIMQGVAENSLTYTGGTDE